MEMWKLTSKLRCCFWLRETLDQMVLDMCLHIFLLELIDQKMAHQTQQTSFMSVKVYPMNITQSFSFFFCW